MCLRLAAVKPTKSFLSRIADEVIQMPQESTLIILPTRRAAAELKQLLAGKLARPSMLPVILGVSDFNERTGALPVVEEERLLLELYSIYRKHDPKETMAGFAGWGIQLLKDFNEIDLQLVYANDLFRRMADLREMEMDFNPSEDRDNFMQFWKELSAKEISPLQQQFIRYWELLPFVYHDFRNHLIEKGFAYEGLSLRLTAESPDLPSWLNRFSHIVYAGFYALNRVEEKFLEKAGREKKLLVLKDADNWYVDNAFSEAGMFFRKGLMSDPAIGWKENYLLESSKKYKVVSTAGNTAMSREIAVMLSGQLKADPASATNTVVILPDENLLYSFLNFCQSLEIPVNPSMGFPLTQHAMWQVLETLRMVRTGFPETSEPSILHRKRELLESNPLVKKLLQGNNQGALEKLFEEIIIPDSKGIKHEQELLINLLVQIDSVVQGFTAQASSAFIKEVQIASDTLLEYSSILYPLAWWKLIMDTLRPLRIPYKADREKGVHVMGFLETRVLDFSHVYIASMNEGKFPSSAVSTSLIPYVIRKYYGLPCREEQEAVTAYHFYRLMQRTEYINLFYDDSPDAMGGGEKSRFLLQLFHELIPEQKQAETNYLQVINPPSPLVAHPVSILKSPEVLEKLETKYTGEKGYLSASAINTYIHCPLKFYFEQVAGIRSGDDVTDTLEANIMGLVLHRSMERIYGNHNLITAELIDSLITTSDEEVLTATAEKYRPGTLFGHDLLMQEVIKKLVKQILENDKKEAPFEIVAVEKESKGKITVGNRNINLKGFIDRLDIHQNVLRILDYKTGQDEAKMPSDISKLYSDPKNKTAFQLLFYLYLIQPEKDGKEAKAGIFCLSRDNQFSYLKDTDTALLEESDFENNLRRIISEIYNPEVAFSQTQDTKRCVFCDFAGICSRT